jgi:hypothetical protein
MTMLTQTQIHQLDLYVQKDVGEEGYIDPQELLIVVDHPSWTRSKKLNMNNGTSSLSSHVERGRITTPPSSTVNIVFDTAFTETPIGSHKVYRITTKGTDERHSDVLIKSEKVTTSGVSIIIDSREALTGIIIEWYYT